jgi:hypothetical protein
MNSTLTRPTKPMISPISISPLIANHPPIT